MQRPSLPAPARAGRHASIGSRGAALPSPSNPNLPRPRQAAPAAAAPSADGAPYIRSHPSLLLGRLRPARRMMMMMRAAPVGGGGAGAAAAEAAAAAKATEEQQQQQQPLSHSSSNGNNGNGHAAVSSLGAAISAAAAEGADAAASESRRRLAEATANATTPHQHQQGIRNPAHALDILYRFSRPHTMIGTFLSVMSVSAMALSPTMLFSPPAAATSAVALALAAALCANVAIVGLNQLYDVEIDRVNKPYLPLASGELTIAQGWGIVAATAVASLVLAVVAASPPLLATVAGSLLLGLVYSTELPFMRWKRSPVLAAACILAVRAVAVQLGFFLHAKRALVGVGGVAATTAATTATTTVAPLAFAVSFMALFSVVIALFKDLPDVRGDRANGIATFSVRFGTPRVFACCVAILAAAYAGGVVYGLDMARRAVLAAASSSGEPVTSSLALMVLPGLLVAGGHAVLGGWLVARSKQVDASSPASLTAHYMWVWKLFYAEYLLLPLLR